MPELQLQSRLSSPAPEQVKQTPPPHNQYQYISPPAQHSQQHPGLRIEVPTNNSQEALGDAIDFSSSAQFSLPDLEAISQLPTPILPSAPFKSHDHRPQNIEVRKRSHAPLVDNCRVVSAFEFEPPMRNSIYSSSPRSLPGTRHISDPARFSVDTTSKIPLPPLESPSSLLVGLVVHAPQLQKHFSCEAVVGKGSFSTVVSARSLDQSSENILAVKIITFPAEEPISMLNFASFIVREVGILTHLRHPSIIRLLDYNLSIPISPAEVTACYENDSLLENMLTHDIESADLARSKQFFFLEYCSGGNLYNWLVKQHKHLSKTTAFWRLMARVVSELVVAMAYAHSQRVVHRDLKLENILLNNPFDVLSELDDPRLSQKAACTITDFGLSKRILLDDQILSTKCGSQDYVSPELLLGLNYDGKLLDLWAIGVMVYSILENRLPFDLPPMEFMKSSGISPSVLKRQRNRHSPARRIAMIDWDWYEISVLLKNESLSSEAAKIIGELQSVVECLLVRKEKRIRVDSLLEDERFQWIKRNVPQHFYRFN